MWEFLVCGPKNGEGNGKKGHCIARSTTNNHSRYTDEEAEAACSKKALQLILADYYMCRAGLLRMQKKVKDKKQSSCLCRIIA